jgi:hypothetical protein
MRPSLTPGKLLPESEDDFLALRERRHPALTVVCKECKAPFSSANTRTPEGWRDTQIIGWCETCYDALLFPNGPLPPEPREDETEGTTQ